MADLGLRLLRFGGDEMAAMDSTLAPARVPMAGTLREKGINVFRCPACAKEFRHDDEYEPMCTGPGALDTHPMAVMTFVRVDPFPRFALVRP